MKGTYQIYDESGNPSQAGTYEYWWKSPGVDRYTWNRADATRTEWHTISGETVYKGRGDRLYYFEHKLETFLFSPIPSQAMLDTAGTELERANSK